MSAESVSQNSSQSLSRSRWLIGPWVDLLFLCNVYWPILLLGVLWTGIDQIENLQFWQIYFVTTPHRWVTLGLVFLDGDRFRARAGAYLGILATVVGVCLLLRVSTGALTCLAMIDFVWNGWHFSAQHHGIYRIYGRTLAPQHQSGLRGEKAVMRVFLCYVPVRIANWSWSIPEWESLFRMMDWGILIIPCWLLLRELGTSGGIARTRLIYLGNVLAIYVGMLMSLHYRQPGLLLIFTTASALFHATEYLTIVSWAVGKRRGESPGTFLSRLVSRWGLVLGAFMLILGAGGWLFQSRFFESWLLLNLMAAFLHYAYDGMIWKGRRS